MEYHDNERASQQRPHRPYMDWFDSPAGPVDNLLEIGALREIGNSVRLPCPHELPGIYAYIF